MTDDQSTGASSAPPTDAPGSDPHGSAAAGQAQRPPLTRSADHRVVAGVCGGLGRHLDIDPVVFRVVVAVLCLTGGLGLFLYGLAWLIVPREAEGERTGRTELQRVLTGRVDGQSIGAVLLTVIGTGVFFSSMGDGDQLFPLMLLGGLVFLAVRYDPERRRRAKGLGRPHRGGPYDRLEPESGEQLDWRSWGRQVGQDFQAEWQARKAEMHEHLHQVHARHAEARAAGTVPADTPPAGPSGYLWDPRHPERNPYGQGAVPPPGVGPQAWWQRTDLPEGDPLRKHPGGAAARRSRAPRPARQHRQHSHLGGVGLLLAAGAAGAVVWYGKVQDTSVTMSAVLAAALLVLGLTLLVGARYGRARGLAVPAMLLTLVLASGGANGSVEASFGDRTWAPNTAAELRPAYSMAAGDLVLDMGALDPAGADLKTRVQLGAGDLRVVVPDDVLVRLTVVNAAGQVRLPADEKLEGLGNHTKVELQPVNGQPSKGTLELTLNVGFGDTKVVQG
ncbi:PspC domain-containing protein [Kitasatospora camelliae]|uniref:PspC domain-containing protein n=1 Tax=Kitasatospora camelliae TaxID=3156397 RepID=A0AAU8JY20_9ACTN